MTEGLQQKWKESGAGKKPFLFSGIEASVKMAGFGRLGALNKSALSFALLIGFLSAVFLFAVFFNSESRFKITGFASSGVNVIDVPPLKPNIYLPENDSLTYNESINFFWNNTIDPNGDSVTYEFILANNLNFSPEGTLVNQTGISETPEKTNTNPIVSYSFINYYWRVRAFDSANYSNWSDAGQFRYCFGNSPPSPPLINPISSFTINKGDYFIYKVIASDPDGDSLSFTDNSALFTIDNSSGLISFQANDTGTFIITIVISDACSAIHEIFTLNVIPLEVIETGDEGGGTGGVAGTTNESQGSMGNETGGEGDAAKGSVFISKYIRENKNESGITNKPVEELTPKEAARFTRAEIIYIGNFKLQNIFNVTTYEGPIWFFIYNDKNYFLTLTNMSGDSIFIGFFSGPGFLFRKPAETLVDLDKDEQQDIRISYERRLGGKYEIILESVKTPRTELPKFIPPTSVISLIAINLIILILLLLFIWIKAWLAEKRRSRDPLEISKRIFPCKDSKFRIQISVLNLGSAMLENLALSEVIPENSEIVGEVSISKKASGDIKNEISGNMLMISATELSKGESFIAEYTIKRSTKPELTTVKVNYQIKIMDAYYIDFSKKYP
ncbi:MAG: hypothetical protein NTV63_04145 [Candidatus Woesearchaeota archaeon]|nr:hypothetical protein [Candidatus Woesearchaeota archaeon]